MATKQFSLIVLFLLVGFRGPVFAQIPDGYVAPEVPQGPVIGIAGAGCLDLGFADSQAECPFAGVPLGPAVPIGTPRMPVPGIMSMGVLPGENSINFPTPDLITTIWQDVLGLPTNQNCPVISAPIPLPLCGGTSPAMDAGPADPTLDNRANALAQAINKTGVQVLQNPCTVVGWYAASAAAGAAGAGVANSEEVFEFATTEGLNWAIQKWLNFLWQGYRPGLGIIAAGKFYGKLAWNGGKAACNAMQP